MHDSTPEAPIPNSRWIPTPAFMLRRSAISDMTRDWCPGSFLECGIGTGSMTKEFLSRGFTGIGFDIENDNLAASQTTLANWNQSIRLTNRQDAVPKKSVDYLWAFEVLEHIENDRAALDRWTRCLKSEGKVLITVPARTRKFRADDRYAGHVRRYERVTLTRLLESCGYCDIRISNYGFPLFNVSRLVGAWLHARRMKQDGTEELSQVERSVRSGVDRIDDIHSISWMINEATLAPFCFLQRAFYRFDISDGYVATATKAASSTAASKGSAQGYRSIASL